MATSTLKTGQTVKTTGKESYQGILRYVGTVQGAPGTWCGIELPEETGKNDGSAKGHRYFTCPPGHGVFVRKEVVTPVVPPKTTSKRASTIAPTATPAKATSTTPASKRTSIAPASRFSTTRQSISSTTSAKKPTSRPTSRPTSQVLSRDASLPSAKRASVQSIPRDPSPEKQKPVELLEEQSQDDDENEDEEEDDEKEQEQEQPVNAAKPPIRETSIRNTAPHTPTSTRNSTRGPTGALAEITRENEQLKVKLRTMEKKRMEDRDAIKQIDTLKSENDRLTNIIQTMSAKMRKTNEEKTAIQARIQELEKEKETEPERPAQLESELELATLDKEMAEEKADALQYELDIASAKLQELEADLTSLREENNELASSMTEEEKAGAGWIHLERERDRLREALLLLRDSKQEVEADLREEIEYLRDNLNETEETANKYFETAEHLQRVEDTNQHLKDQLEAAENQEEVISTMMQERDRHLAQIEELRSSLSELEELAQTNEDLERLYLDNEKNLLSRIDEQEAMLHDQDRVTVEKDQAIEDLEYTLSKFRSFMQNMQAEIDEARRTKEISELQAHEMNSRSKAMMELNMKLQSNASKSQTKAIELETVKAQAQISKSHVDILSLFLPESFDSERNPIQALLTFSRLKSKAGLVANLVLERLRDRGFLNSGEETLAGFRVVESSQWIHLTADRFMRFMSACTPAQFAAFSNVGQEIEPVERAITNWLEALKNDELNADSPEHMKRMESVLADLVEKLLPSGPEVKASQNVAETQMIVTHAEVAAALLDWLGKAVKAKLGGPNEEDSQSIDFDRKIDQLSRMARTAKLSCAKVVNELQKKRTRSSCLEETAWPLFTDVVQHASKIDEQIQQLCQIILSYLNDIDLDEESSYSVLLDSLNSGDDDIFSALFNDLKSLLGQIETLLHKSQDSSTSLSFEPLPAPWIVRAKDIKAQRLMSTEVQEELVQAARKNQELIFRIGEKERAIEEMTIRAELAEKRVKDNKSKEGQDKILKDEISRLKSDKTELESQLSQTQTSLIDLQEESARDKEEIMALQTQSSEQVANGTALPPSAKATDPVIGESTSAHVKALLAEVAGLEAAVRHLRWENHELSVPVSETKFQAATQAWLDPSHLQPTRTKGSQRQARARLEHRKQKQSDALDALLEMSASGSMRPVRLKSTLKKDDGWRSVRETTRWQVLRQKEEVEAWDALLDREHGVSEGFVVQVV